MPPRSNQAPLSETEMFDICTKILDITPMVWCNYEPRKSGESCPACSCVDPKDNEKNRKFKEALVLGKISTFMKTYSDLKSARRDARKELEKMKMLTNDRIQLCEEFYNPENNIVTLPGHGAIFNYLCSPCSTAPRLLKTPWCIPDIDSFKDFFIDREETYETYHHDFKCRTAQRKCVSDIFDATHLYLQHGLGGEDGEREEEDHSPVELYFTEIYGKKWKSTIIKHIKHLVPPGMVLQAEPCWITGKSPGFSRTHCDDYFNCALVLHGEKTFYCAPPDSIDGKKQQGIEEHNAYDVNTSVETGRPMDPRFTEYEMSAGDMLCIPPGWWHTVVTEPGCVMQTFWFNEECLNEKKNRKRKQ